MNNSKQMFTINISSIILILMFFLFNFIFFTDAYRENLALRHPCNSVNKRLGPYITWTEKLASSQYKVQKDACGQIGSGPACCTNEIVNSYALSLANDLKNLLDGELNHLSSLFSLSKQQIDLWSREYITESRRLTVSSLESLFGTEEYRLNVHYSLTSLFNVLSNIHSTVDDVSRSTIDLFNHLIISLYRQFIMNDNRYSLDENFEKCLVNAAFNIEALPQQRELLYILTSASTLMQIFHTMLIYIDADIRQLEATTTLNTNECVQRYAREALCPICMTTLSPYNPSDNLNDVSEILCQDDCRYVIKTCFNQTNNPYVTFAKLASGYSATVKEIEQAVVELKLVEHLSKLHIYLYDMVVNATNNRNVYNHIQTICPNSNVKPFSPLLSLPPTIIERREIVFQWNRTLHFVLKQFQTSIDNLNIRLTQKIIADICSNPNYGVKSNQCTQIDKQDLNNLIQWPLPSIPQSPYKTINPAELTRNQLNELKKKMVPVHQIIVSLQPKKKYSLIEYIPDFESYTDDINMDNDNIDSASFIETYDNDIPESLSERLYQAFDGTTTRRSIITTRKHLKEKQTTTSSNGQLLTYNIRFYLIILIIHRIKSISF